MIWTCVIKAWWKLTNWKESYLNATGVEPQTTNCTVVTGNILENTSKLCSFLPFISNQTKDQDKNHESFLKQECSTIWKAGGPNRQLSITFSFLKATSAIDQLTAVKDESLITCVEDLALSYCYCPTRAKQG